MEAKNVPIKKKLTDIKKALKEDMERFLLPTIMIDPPLVRYLKDQLLQMEKMLTFQEISQWLTTIVAKVKEGKKGAFHLQSAEKVIKRFGIILKRFKESEESVISSAEAAPVQALR